MAFNFEVNPVAINNISKTLENLSKSLKLQDKTVEIDSNGQEIVTADSEYDGLGKVTINTDVPTKPEEVLTETITENGLKTFNPTAGSVFSSASITVNVPEKKIEAEKTVNITENKETVITPTPDNEGMARVVVTTNVPQPTLEENKTQTISSNSVVEVTPSAGNDGMKKATITVNVPEKKIEANKTQSIVTNGETVITPTEGNDGMAKVTVNVNVPGSVLQDSKSVNITENKTESVTPDEGFDAIKKVDVTVNIPLEEKKTQTISSNSTVTITPTEGNTAMKSVEVTVNVPSSGGSGFRTSDFIGFPSFLALTSEQQQHIIDNLTIDTDSVSELFYSAVSSSENELKINLNFDFSNIVRSAYFIGQEANNAISQVYTSEVTINNVNHNVMYADYMFGYAPINKITINGNGSIAGSHLCLGSNIREFSAENISFTKTEGMFQGCRNLRTVSNLTIDNGRELFASSGIIETPEIIVTKQLSDSFQMFQSNTITTIGKITLQQGGDFITPLSIGSNVTTMAGIEGLNGDSNFSRAKKLSNASIQNLIDTAADVTSLGTRTMIFHSTPFATITEEQRGAATAKGWTLASA